MFDEIATEEQELFGARAVLWAHGGDDCLSRGIVRANLPGAGIPWRRRAGHFGSDPPREVINGS
jgi:hypothetical protein